MGRRNQDQGHLFDEFHRDEADPDDHLVPQIGAVLGLSWVHVELAPYHSRFGRPSIDPALMIRMLIVGYVFAIRSARQICREVQVNLADRWFCDLGHPSREGHSARPIPRSPAQSRSAAIARWRASHGRAGTAWPLDDQHHARSLFPRHRDDAGGCGGSTGQGISECHDGRRKDEMNGFGSNFGSNAIFANETVQENPCRSIQWMGGRAV